MTRRPRDKYERKTGKRMPDEQPQPEPPEPDYEEVECDECGKESEVPEGNTLCSSCAEGTALSQIEAPEGGWPRGSDMDRI